MYTINNSIVNCQVIYQTASNNIKPDSPNFVGDYEKLKTFFRHLCKRLTYLKLIPTC